MQVKFGKLYIDTEELKSKEMQSIMAKYHKDKQFPIHCGCNNAVTMHIRKNRNDYYSLSTNPNKLQAHEPFCENSLNLPESELQGTHYRVLEEINENELKVNARHLNILMKEKSLIKLSSNPTTKSYTASSMTLGSFGREWLSRAWEHAIEAYQKEPRFYPSSKVVQIALNNLFVHSNALMKVNITKTVTLADVLWIGQKKPQSFHYYNQSKIRPVVLCRLLKDQVRLDDEHNYMVLPVEGLGKDITYEVAVSLEGWEIARKNCRVNYEQHQYYYIVGYGVAAAYGKLPTVERIELIPTTQRGMFVDSSYEAQLFEEFENKRRIYKRMNQRMDEFNGYDPDALLLDTEKVCIVEVFGMSESNESYHEAKDRKMKYYRTLEDYSTYYWHAYRTKTMPAFPPKAKKTRSSN